MVRSRLFVRFTDLGVGLIDEQACHAFWIPLMLMLPVYPEWAIFSPHERKSDHAGDAVGLGRVAAGIRTWQSNGYECLGLMGISTLLPCQDALWQLCDGRI